MTLASIAEHTGRSIKSLRRLVERGRLKARACDVRTRALLFELWEAEGTLRATRPYRRVARSDR